MNIIKFCFILIFPFILSSCSVHPWKTIKFVSCSAEKLTEMERSDIEDMGSDDIIGNVFFYFVSNGIEDTMYETKPPYSINFVFESFDENTVVTVNTITMEFDGEKVFIEEGLLPLDITIDMHGYLNPELYWGHFKTSYVYNLQKVHEISATVNATINNNEIEVTKDLKATAMKKISRGIFQYRY